MIPLEDVESKTMLSAGEHLQDKRNLGMPSQSQY